MNNHIFLEALYGVLHNCPLQREEVSVEEWLECLEIAGIHHMIPVIYPAIAASPAARKVGTRFFEPFVQNQAQEPEPVLTVRRSTDASRESFYITCDLEAAIADFRDHFNRETLDMRDLLKILGFVKQEGARVNWDMLLNNCRSCKLDQIAASIFTIGSRYLGVDLSAYPGTEGWREISVDEGPLLDYLLNLGRYVESEEDEKRKAEKRKEEAAGVSRAARRGSAGSGWLPSFFRSNRRAEREDWEQKRVATEAAMNRAKLDRRDAVTRGYGLA